ncbi:unnamed protein product, partial [Hymenolepis diminuta]
RRHTLVSVDSYTSCSSPLLLSTLLSLFLSLSLLLIGASLNTFLVYSTLGVLLHNCCWLLLKQLRISCRNLLAANRWLLSNSNKPIEKLYSN